MTVATKGGPRGGARRRPEGRGESAPARGVVGGPRAIIEGILICGWVVRAAGEMGATTGKRGSRARMRN